MVVDAAKRVEMTVVNTSFKKERHRVTYMSGSRSTQIDYILCRGCDLQEFKDSMVVSGKSVAKQHRGVINKSFEVKSRRKFRTEPKIKWWNLKGHLHIASKEEVRQGGNRMDRDLRYSERESREYI